MMKHLGVLLALALLAGCNRAAPVAVDTETKFITPEQRSKMPAEERNDPYVLMHSENSGRR